jgi:propanol-preferring alcohol dehydrogenase
MRAIILPRTAPIEQSSLVETDLPTPEPSENEILIKVSVCGLCHTDLDEIEGRLTPPRLPVVPGHQVVGTVIDKGNAVTRHRLADRVGITWLYSSCGRCSFCQTDQENLCPQAQWTGLDANGGYAEYMVVAEHFAHPIPATFSDAQAAPLLCAGVIGYRAVRLSNITDGQTVALFGFGASAHIVIQILRFKFPHNPVFVITRGRDHQALAHRLGAAWTGSPAETPPSPIDRAIDFTPVGQTIPSALALLKPGGRLVINAIRKTTPVPELPYHEVLWHEREIKSVANVTRRDAREFLPLAARIPIQPTVTEFEPRQVSNALALLKQGDIEAAALLRFADDASDNRTAGTL